MDLDLECFRFLPPPLFICMLKRSRVLLVQKKKEGWGDGEGGERSDEKDGNAEINTGLIDSTQPHAKLYAK